MPLVSSAQSIQALTLSSGVNPELQNAFPVDLSYLVWHHNVDGYIDATAVSVVKSRSSTKVNVPEGSILELFEPISLAVPRGRLPRCVAGGLLPSMGDAVNTTMARLEAAVNSHDVNVAINYAVEQTQAQEELSKLDVTYAIADSETKALQRYAAVTTMALSALYTSDQVRISIHPSGGVSRVCETTAGSQDWIGLNFKLTFPLN
jgi:hypothetical protein